MTNSRILTDDGSSLFARIDGPAEAPVLLFLNSLGTNLQMWDLQVAALSPAMRLVRFDTRGHGRSDVPPGPYSIERLGRDALSVLDQFQVERANLCGLSLGGVIAIWMAVNHPERVNHAIFADTAARIGTTQTWTERITAVTDGGMGAILSLVMRRFLSESFRQQNPDQERFVREMVAQTPAAGYIASCAALRDADLRNIASTIRAPSLVICGELDEATLVAQAYELHKLIRGSKLAVIPSAGHLSNIEQPDTFNRSLVEFISESMSSPI